MTLHQGGDLAAVTADQQVTLPVTGHRTVLNRGRPLADRYRAGNAAVGIRLLRMTTPAAHHPGTPQMLQQLFLQGPAGLDEEASVDRLVRHLVVLVVRIRVLEPAGDLLRGPQPVQLAGHDAGQCSVLQQFTGLGSARPLPGGLVSNAGPVAPPTTVTLYLTTHR